MRLLIAALLCVVVSSSSVASITPLGSPKMPIAIEEGTDLEQIKESRDILVAAIDELDSDIAEAFENGEISAGDHQDFVDRIADMRGGPTYPTGTQDPPHIYKIDGGIAIVEMGQLPPAVQQAVEAAISLDILTLAVDVVDLREDLEEATQTAE